MFDHVALAGEPANVAADPGGRRRQPRGLAADRELDLAAVQHVMDGRGAGWTLTDGADLEAWIGDTVELTDDYAPVDQLLEP